MRTLKALCFGLFLGIPYGILAIIIARYLKEDNPIFWITIIMLFIGMLSLLVLAILPSRKDKSE